MIRSPRAILALLTLLNFVNYLDRYLVNAVAPKIQESLGTSNAEIGIVISAFMLGYFLTSPVFGRLGDRYPRKGLIAAGVLVWSIATMASGLATSFGTMVATRVVVGVGEASYATLSPTIIDNIAPSERKNRYLAIFYLATPVGSALGFVLGGLLEHSYGWQKAFFIAGGPGILLALVTLLIREPARETSPSNEPARTSAEDYRALSRNRSYLLIVGGYVAQTFALGGFVAWSPKYLTSALGMELHKADFWLGAIAVITGFAGTALGGYWADRIKGDRLAACFKVCTVSSLFSAPFALLCLFMPTPATFFIAAGLCELSIFLSVAPTNSAILMSVPSYVRASAMAVSIFAIHLLGDLISPPLIGAIADASGGNARALRLGMFLLPAAFAVSAIVWRRGMRLSAAPAEAGSTSSA